MSSIKYRPEVDGLRTIAVLPVILFHLGHKWISGGFLGVDVFFVISGYLITAIILKDFEAGNFSLKRFWIRRIRRIFPVLSIVVIATLVASFFVSYRPDLISYGKVGLASIFSVSNIVLWRISGDYWGVSAESSPFLHTWSLAVEEQFYFFYPVALVLLLKFRSKYLGYIIAASIVASFTLFVLGSVYKPSATFYLIPTRAWELAVGCLVAVLHYRGHLELPKRTRSLLSIVGLLMILISYVCIDGSSGLSALQALSVVGAGLIIVNNQVDGVVNRALATPFMVYVGKMSYSLYLWHWPVIVLGKSSSRGDLTVVSQFQMLAVTTVLSLLSYYLIEKTTRKMVHIFRLTSVTFVLSAALAIFFVYGNYGLTYETSQYEKVEYYGQQYNLAPSVPVVDGELQLKRKGIYAPARHEKALKGLYRKGGIIKSYGDATPQVVLLGDSHAQMWARTIDEICEELDVSIAFNTITGNSPFFEIPLDKNPSSSKGFSSEEEFEFNSSVLEKLAEWKPALVVIGHRWQNTLKSKIPKRDLIEFIGAFGGNVLLLEQPPLLAIGNTNTSMFFSYINLVPLKNESQYYETTGVDSVSMGRQMMTELALDYSHVDYFKVFDTFSEGSDKAWVMNGNTILYYDDDHLSHQGTLLLRDKLKTVIEKTTKD